MEKLLTTNELAELLGVHRTTIYTMRKKGMPVIQVLGAPRFDHSQVMEWINNESQHADKKKQSTV